MCRPINSVDGTEGELESGIELSRGELEALGVSIAEFVEHATGIVVKVEPGVEAGGLS